jgi:hypothetical protein
MSNKVIENLQDWLMPFALNIRKIARGDKKIVAYFPVAFPIFIFRGFGSSPESLKIIIKIK